MSIKQYKDIASMQNPGKQRTGKAGGGRVGANEGGERESLIKKSAAAIKKGATDPKTYERILSNAGIPFSKAALSGMKALREHRQEGGKDPLIGKGSKWRKKREARRKAKGK